MSMSALSDELAQVRTKKKEFLAQIERIVPWKEWLVLIQPCYYKGCLLYTSRPFAKGRKPSCRFAPEWDRTKKPLAVRMS